jgi:hypothetical protein
MQKYELICAPDTREVSRQVNLIIEKNKDKKVKIEELITAFYERDGRKGTFFIQKIVIE